MSRIDKQQQQQSDSSSVTSATSTNSSLNPTPSSTVSKMSADAPEWRPAASVSPTSTSSFALSSSNNTIANSMNSSRDGGASSSGGGGGASATATSVVNNNTRTTTPPLESPQLHHSQQRTPPLPPFQYNHNNNHRKSPQLQQHHQTPPQHRLAATNMLLVVDFEATCLEVPDSQYIPEIIEFPVIAIDCGGSTTTTTENNPPPRVIAEFHSYVKPVVNPLLNEFTTKLTGIRQEQVDAAPPLQEVIYKFSEWYQSTFLSNISSCLCTDGSHDVREFVFRCSVLTQRTQWPVTPSFFRWIDIKETFSNFLNIPYQGNITTMLDILGMTFEGRPHSGIDDARNLSKIVIALLEKGAAPFFRIQEIQSPPMSAYPPVMSAFPSTPSHFSLPPAAAAGGGGAAGSLTIVRNNSFNNNSFNSKSRSPRGGSNNSNSSTPNNSSSQSRQRERGDNKDKKNNNSPSTPPQLLNRSLSGNKLTTKLPNNDSSHDSF